MFQRKPLIHAGALALLSGLIFGIFCLIPTSYTVDVGGYDSAYMQGFFDQESIPTQFTHTGKARWSGVDAAIILPQIATPMTVTLRVISPIPKTLTISINDGSTVIRQPVHAQWQDIAFQIADGQQKPFTLHTLLRSEVAPWQAGDFRQVGVLVDTFTVTTPAWSMPYPWPIAWVILCSVLSTFVLRTTQIPAWHQYVMAVVFPVIFAAVTWRWQFWYPVPHGTAIVCGVLAIALCVHHHRLIISRFSWWGDALSWITIVVWSVSAAIAQRAHLTLAVPGVEKDFRSFASRTDSLADVFAADPFYNFGYPFILYTLRQINGTTAFDSARWWSVMIACCALVATWWLARFLFGQYWGAFMTITVASSALFTQYALSFGSDMTFTALTTLACALLVRAPARPWWCIGVGVISGLAFSVRHTGIILLAVLVIWFIIPRIDRATTVRQIALLCVGWLLGAGTQLVINYLDTGQLLFSYQAKNSWLAVYGNLDWGRWGDVPDSIGLSEVIFNDPLRFATSWWYNMTAIWGRSNAADERALFQRLLSFPANWMSIAGIIVCIQWWWRFGIPRTHQFIIVWLVGFISVSSMAFILPRFLLPLVWVAAFFATWVMTRLTPALPTQLRIWVIIAVLLVQSGGVQLGQSTVIDGQPRDERNVLAHVSATYPAARIAFVTGRESPLGKYSALANVRTFRTITAPVDINALCQSAPTVIIWSRELQPLPQRFEPLWQQDRYVVVNGQSACAGTP
ncbi:MAG: ArnT family glycosyltransferase [Roseiflexaceae bacterium]